MVTICTFIKSNKVSAIPILKKGEEKNNGVFFQGFLGDLLVDRLIPQGSGTLGSGLRRVRTPPHTLTHRELGPCGRAGQRKTGSSHGGGFCIAAKVQVCVQKKKKKKVGRWGKRSTFTTNPPPPQQPAAQTLRTFQRFPGNSVASAPCFCPRSKGQSQK